MPRNEFFDSLLQEIEDNEDGNFQIRNEGGFAVLSVSKPGKNGRRIELNEVTNRLRLFGIEKYDEKQVSLIVKQAENKEYRIAEWKGGKPEDSLIEMDVNPDGMKAYLRILPPKHGGKLQTKASLLKSLNDAGIKYGIKEDNLDLLIRNQVFFSRTLVAEGTPPGETKHGYIKVHFESNGKPSLTEDFSGRVDLKNVGFIQTVKKGELLAERVHPEKGESGMDVFGKELPSPEGTRPPWRLGDNCQLSEDDEKLYSKIDGRPVLGRDGSIRVDEVCLLNNVDYSTGNVDFPGTIIVEGRIADDFKLSTRGSLIIKKSVGRVFLSADGDIVLNGGVMGKGGGSIESKADIYAKFCEQAYLKATKSIFIHEASMHSRLVAGENIVIQGGRGEFIGGEAIAGKSIIVGKLGAVVETKTSLYVGIPPERLDELEKLKQEAAKQTDFLDRIRKNLFSLTETSNKRELDAEEKIFHKKLQIAEKNLSVKLNGILEQHEELLNSFEPSKENCVEIEKSMHPRVTINFGKNKIFHSELRTYDGRNYIYLADDMLPILTSVPPKKPKKDKEKK